MGELTPVERARASASLADQPARVPRASSVAAWSRWPAAAWSRPRSRPERASAHHICGHTFTTDSCPHPYAPLSRTDSYGFPVHPTYGYPGRRRRGDLHRPRHAGAAQDLRADRAVIYHFVKDPQYGGGWTRCCYGRLRHIQDCCSHVEDPDQRRRRRSPATARRPPRVLHHVPGAARRRARRRAGRRRSSPRRRSPAGPRSTVPEACRWWRPSPPWSTGDARAGWGRSRCTRSARPATAALFGAALGCDRRRARRAVAAPGAARARDGRRPSTRSAALTRLRVPVPQLRRQVPDWWRTFFGRPFAACPVRRRPRDRLPDVPAERHARGGRVRGGRRADARRSGRSSWRRSGWSAGCRPSSSWRSTTQEQSRRARRSAGRRVGIGPPDRERRRARPDRDRGRRRIDPRGRRLVAGPSPPRRSPRCSRGRPHRRSWHGAVGAARSPLTACRRRSSGPPPGRSRRRRRSSRCSSWRGCHGWPPSGRACWSPCSRWRSSVRGDGWGGRVPCGCFGARDVVDVNAALARNLGLVLIAAFVFARAADATTVSWPGVPGADDVVPLTLAFGALATSALVAWRGSVWLARGRRA